MTALWEILGLLGIFESSDVLLMPKSDDEERYRQVYSSHKERVCVEFGPFSKGILDEVNGLGVFRIATYHKEI